MLSLLDATEIENFELPPVSTSFIITVAIALISIPMEKYFIAELIVKTV